MNWSKRQWPRLGLTACVIVVGSSCSLLAPGNDDLLGAAGASGAGGRGDPVSGAAGEDDTQAGAGGTGGTGTGTEPPPGGAPGLGCDELVCDVNADCVEGSRGASCECRSGFTGDGTACRRFVSCNELHQAEPDLPSGAYPIRPAALTSDIETYCEMSAEDGGWTLILNEGLSFDALTAGVADQLCFDASCTNLSYSTVLLQSDVMLDMSEAPIEGDIFTARAVFTAVDLRARGKTVRELFTTGPYFLDEDDNSNLTVVTRDGDTCAEALPYQMSQQLCETCPASEGCGVSVVVFGDSDSICAGAGALTFAIGAADSHTAPWTQCAGWPQEANYGAYNYLPDYFRVWIR